MRLGYVRVRVSWPRSFNHCAARQGRNGRIRYVRQAVGRTQLFRQLRPREALHKGFANLPDLALPIRDDLLYNYQ